MVLPVLNIEIVFSYEIHEVRELKALGKFGETSPFKSRLNKASQSLRGVFQIIVPMGTQQRL